MAFIHSHELIEIKYVSSTLKYSAEQVLFVVCTREAPDKISQLIVATMTEVFLRMEQFLQSNDGIQTAVRTSKLEMTCFISTPPVSAVLKANVRAMFVVTCILAYHGPRFTT
jgi:hypothetical protein